MIELLVVILLVLLLVGPIRGRLGEGPYYDPVMMILLILLIVFLARGHLF